MVTHFYALLALYDHFSYNGRVKITTFSRGILNQAYLGKTAHVPVWEKDVVEQWSRSCEAGELVGSYGVAFTAELFKGLHRIKSDITGGRVLVIGSENPWVEACALAAGAASVVTLEYGAIKSSHPQVTTLTPSEMRQKYASGTLGEFDVILTMSSVEHSGLGRYGDALNPYGDLQAIARAWCVARPKAPMLIAVPHEKTKFDTIEFNAHRIYGPVMYSNLVANWQQIHFSYVDSFQPLLTVRKVATSPSSSKRIGLRGN